MFRSFMKFKKLKDTLESLVEQRVIIILERGQRLIVEVDAVADNLLVTSVDGRIFFIDIECICAVVTCCEEVLESLLTEERSRRRHVDEGIIRRHEEEFFQEIL